jgi:uncharacterized protein YecT (DUF1311 family)
MRVLVFVFATLFMAGFARADVKKELARIEARLDACMKVDGSNSGMKQCTSSAYQAADKILNETYQQLSKSWSAGDSDSVERKKRLVAAQRAWVAFRDADCSLQASDMLGGTGEGLIVLGCLYKATSDRAKQLEELMQ